MTKIMIKSGYSKFLTMSKTGDRSLHHPRPLFSVSIDIMFLAPYGRNGYSLETVKPSIMQVVGSIDKMTADAKAIELRRKEIVADPNEFVKSVNEFVKIFSDKLDDLEKTLKKKIADYQYKVELERREQERKQKEAAEALQKRLQAEADEANRKAREEAMRKAEAEAKSKREREE